MELSEKELLREIAQKLDQLIAVIVTQGRSKEEQIAVLRNLDFDWKFIGKVVGMAPDAARKRYSRSSG